MIGRLCVNRGGGNDSFKMTKYTIEPAKQTLITEAPNKLGKIEGSC